MKAVKELAGRNGCTTNQIAEHLTIDPQLVRTKLKPLIIYGFVKREGYVFNEGQGKKHRCQLYKPKRG